MFPTPATRSWFSRNAFTGCLRPRAWSRRASAVKSGLSGSTPSREAKYSARASLPSSTSPVPKRRTSTNRSCLPVVELHAHAGVLRLLVGEQEVSGHAEVHHEVHVVLERDDQVLPAPAEPLDDPAVERVCDRLGRRRVGPARVEHLDVLEPPPLDGGRQLAANRLDLGKLGHPPGSSRPVPAPCSARVSRRSRAGAP